MPVQLYEKDDILDACVAVFAREGYENASTASLAEAAGVSKALIFHHFNSKKDLYLSIIDQSFERGREALGIDAISASDDFFEARERFSIEKFNFMKNNPGAYKLLIEAFFDTPPEVAADVKERYGALMDARRQLWRRLFEKVRLRDGVDRKQAFELILMTLDYFDEKYVPRFLRHDELDDTLLHRFLQERNSFLEMIRFGIEAQDE